MKSVEKKQLIVSQMELKVIPKADIDVSLDYLTVPSRKRNIQKFFAVRKLKHKQDEKVSFNDILIFE